MDRARVPRMLARGFVVLCLASGSVHAQPQEPEPPKEPESPPPSGGELGGSPFDDKQPAPTPSQPTTPIAVDPPPATEPTPPPEPFVKGPPDTTPYAIDEDRPPSAPDDRGFRFGSYGRVLAGTDLRGGKPEAANVVAHGPRIVEPSYLELDFSYGFDTPSGKRLRPVITLAFDGTLFHDTGDFDAQPALRNLFLEAQLTRELTGWVGSRMYRGDDIYLFDYWPLDDQNTVGGGVIFRKHETENYGGNVLEVAAHAGVNRLDNPFQFQEIEVADPEQGATTVEQLNRQRLIASTTASYTMDNGIADPNFKFKLHGELHALPSGTRKIGTDGTLEDLPSDRGYLFGVQATTFGFAPSRYGFRRHLNLYFRYAKGLAAFDELAQPTSFGPELKTSRASELTFGASGNFDHALGNVMLGALSRRFVDADTTAVDHDDGWEYAVALRPLAKLGGDVFAGGELSYQARFPRGLNAVTQRAEDPSVLQIAPMLVYSPMGPSAYDRPQIRVVYRAARLNDGARDLYVPDDPRRANTWVHFLGFQAEWWFNSSTYR
ncbi:MAG TPA: carbohydrate porin [Kofleriaceae bacterium]